MVVIDRVCAAQANGGLESASAATPAGGGSGAPAYASGACQAQQPTGRGRSRTVFIDAGHGGPDPGVLGRTQSQSQTQAGGSRARPVQVKESNVALAVATQLAKQLRADGYRVVLSRTGDTSVRRFAADELTDGALDPTQERQDLQARVRCANDSHAQALISIHFNGYTDQTVGGSQTIYDDARPFSDASKRLGDAIQAALLQQLKLDDRGVITDDTLDSPTLSDRADEYGHLMLLGPPQEGWLDHGTAMPGVLVEPLFLTAPAEAAIATSATGQRRIAQALAAGLERHLDGATSQ